jgi:N-acyl-D-aspartate/D-glutamate deacylase
MHDLVIRGGTIVDGTQAPRYLADVAVDSGSITAVEPNVGPGRQEIDAKGLLVTPGFVDIHTHFDGQATWDPDLTPSSWHGVTTAIFGNCGVGFAPVRPGSVPYLVNLMQGVEDIPEVVLTEGVKFNWESFPEYLERLGDLPRIMDVGAQVPHAALRFYVMGERGADHTEQPTEEEVAQMGSLLEEALNAGALGFTTSRTVKHRAGDGRLTPTLSAANPELHGLALAMKRAARGVIEANSDFGPGDFEMLRQMAETAGRPLSCLLVQVDDEPDLWRDTMANIHRARAQKIEATAQVGCRPIGVLIGLETTMNPFADHPAWQAIAHLSPRERYMRLAADAELRRALVRGEHGDPLKSRIFAKLPRAHIIGDTLDYEPDPASNIGALAQKTSKSVREIALEEMMRNEGTAMLLLPHENYNAGNLDVVREMLTDSASVMGVADAGAHLGVICDAGAPTLLITHWTRDRRRGPKLPLEYVIHKQTQATAQAYGLRDRGVLAPGFKADINVIDYDNLSLLPPRVVYDLPAGGRRIVQQARGYKHVFCSGVETVRDDQFTGARPGRVLRGASDHQSSQPAYIAAAE